MKSVYTMMLAIFLMGYPQLWANTKNAESNTEEDVRVMSWNILFNGWEKGKHPSWDKRIPGLVKILKKHRPDLVGLQEDGKEQVAYLTRALPGYSYLDRHQKKGGGLLIRTDAWNVIESGKIEIPGRRQASWALLESTRNSQRWLFYNAHFVHRSAKNSAGYRMDAAERIAKHMSGYAQDVVPVVFTGDFNALHDMPCMRYLAGGSGSPIQLINAFNSHHGADDPRGTWRGLGKDHHGERIDHILINKHAVVQDVEVVYYDELTGVWPSDHYPMLVTLSEALSDTGTK